MLRYNAALSQSISDIQECPEQQQLSEFRSVVLTAFGITPQRRTHCSDDAAKGSVTIMFVRRANYKRRPGHDGALETRLWNEDEISSALHRWAADRAGACFQGKGN